MNPFERINLGKVLDAAHGIKAASPVSFLPPRRPRFHEVREACAKKMRYDKKGALTQLHRLADKGTVDLRIYPCPVCGGWHLAKTKHELA